MHGCQLQVFRDDAGNAVVECPTDPPCFSGRLRVPDEARRYLRLVPETLAREIAKANGLRPFGSHDVDGAWYCGSRAFRDRRRLFVYLTGSVSPVLVHEIKQDLQWTNGASGLVLHGCSVDNTSKRIAEQLGVLFFPLPGGSHWDLSLPMTKLYDQLDPDYLSSRYANNEFIFEDVPLEFACEPGRHVVKVLGQVHPGFTQSDKNFSRLLLLAAHRKRAGTPWLLGR